jgi:hypothetical protein
MLTIRICDTSGALIAEGTCSDSGYFPLALASVYNAAINPTPARSLEHFGSPADSADYPVGTGRATFGYSLSGRNGSGRVLDDEVIVHVERT